MSEQEVKITLSTGTTLIVTLAEAGELREILQTVLADGKGETVNLDECPRGGGNRCRCHICAVCGHRKHTSVHGPFWRGGILIQEPYSHAYRERLRPVDVEKEHATLQ